MDCGFGIADFMLSLHLQIRNRKSEPSKTSSAKPNPKLEYASLAQLVEQLIRNEQVVGSSPIGGSGDYGLRIWD